MKPRSGTIYKDFLFMLGLANCCLAMILFARIGTAQRAEIYPQTLELANEIVADEKKLSFNESWKQLQSGRTAVWQNVANADRFLVQTFGAGMWGPITIAFAYEMADSRIVALRVVDQNETTGIGGRITEEEFTEQFRDILAPQGVEMSLARVANNQFDALSGATVSSRSVQNIINRALSQINKLVSSTGEGQE